MNTNVQKKSTLLISAIILLALSLSACREESREPRFLEPREEKHSPVPKRTPDNDNGANETEELPLASSLEVDSCGSSPPEVALPRNHLLPDCQEIVSVTPQAKHAGSAVDLAVPIEWLSEDSSWATIKTESMNGATSVGWGKGTADIFDAFTGYEPETYFHACVSNDCPEAASDEECASFICRSIVAAGVVNLEGLWCIEGEFLSSPCAEAQVSQNGRSISIQSLQGPAGPSFSGTGKIKGAQVEWRMDDLLFVGTIASSRDVIKGSVYEELTYTHLGSWTAWR